MKPVIGILVVASILLDLYVSVVLYEEWYVRSSVGIRFTVGTPDVNSLFSTWYVHY